MLFHCNLAIIAIETSCINTIYTCITQNKKAPLSANNIIYA